MTKEDKGEIALKRIEQVRKEFEQKLDGVAKATTSNLRDFMERIHVCNIEALAANKYSHATRNFLYSKNIILPSEFVAFAEADPLLNTFNQEIHLIQQLMQDSKTLDPLNPREVEFLLQKNKFRSLELLQLRIDRLELMISALEPIEGTEKKVTVLKGELQKMKEDLKKLFDESKKLPEVPENEHFLKKAEATEQIETLFSEEKDQFIERLRFLPPIDINTHLEPYIKELIVETKKLYCFGCFNSCIINCCVILEAVLKDVVKVKEQLGEVSMDFDSLVKHCKKEVYIDEKEAGWLIDVKDTYRNPYVHSNLEKIVPAGAVPGVRLDFKTGKVSDLKIISTSEVPYLRQEIKKITDPERALHLFKETINLVRTISKKHFNYGLDEESSKK